jgi:hypothetical protein
LILVTNLALLLIAAMGCKSTYADPAYDLIIENQTNQVLTIYTFDTSLVGQVEPGKTIMTYFASYFSNIPIKAENTQREIVFSETYTMQDSKYHLQKVDKSVYKAVIPPLTITPESSGNITGKSVQ